MADLLKLLAVLALIVLLINRGWNLGLVLGLASLLLAILFGHPLRDLGLDAYLAVTDRLTLRLTVIVVLILTLSEILQRTARLDGMVRALEHMIPDTRIVLAVVPALIGLLPMTGGAMFSAPMVGHIGERLRASPARKTFVNYWFRHVWEYVFPLYPSFLLGATLLGLSDREAVTILWPLALASAVGGVLFGLLGLKPPPPSEGDSPAYSSLRQLGSSVWPIALVLALAIGVGLDLVISLLVTIALLAWVNRIGVRQFWEIMRHRIRWSTVILILGAMIFRRVLEETGAVTAASQVLTAMHVPPLVAIFAVPFGSGLMTGMGTAAYAIGFPIILPLASHSPIGPGMVAWVWAGGFLGVMMSPLHLCLALTRVYFQADWPAAYRRILPASLLTAAVALALLLLL